MENSGNKKAFNPSQIQSPDVYVTLHPRASTLCGFQVFQMHLQDLNTQMPFADISLEANRMENQFDIHTKRYAKFLSSTLNLSIINPNTSTLVWIHRLLLLSNLDF